MTVGRRQSRPGSPDAEEIRAQLARVLADDAFARAPVLSRLLRFVVEQGLDGDEASLKEYTLGVEVFDRGVDFDPRTDTIVRVEARRLRTRLRKYYAGAGRDAPVLIDIPKGHYLPAFSRRTGQPAQPSQSRDRRARIRTAALLLALAGLLGAVAWWRLPASSRTVAEAPREPPVIAVLPFLDLSPGGDQLHFSDGLTEEVLHLLARNPDLRVVARTSSFAMRHERLDIPAVADRLDADLVLEGSVRRADDRVRVTAQLVDGESGLHVWSETYDRNVDDVFAVQDAIASAVAAATNVSVAAAPGRVQNTDLAAYEHYLRGRFHFYRRAEGDIERAGRHFREAIAIDQEFARAWAGLAGVEMLEILAGRVPVEAGMRRQREAVERALALDPASAEVHARAAQHYAHAGDSARADAHLQRASALAPNDPLVLSMQAGRERFAGRHETAIALQRRAVAFDPVAPAHYVNLGHFYLTAGRLAEAEAALAQARAMLPDHAGQIEAALALVRVLSGRDAEAAALLAGLEGVDEAEVPRALVASRRRDEAAVDAVFRRLASRGTVVAAVEAARIHAQRGDADAAFAHLEAAMSAADWHTPYSQDRQELLAARHDHLLLPLHGDPRWAALVRRIPGR